MKYREAGVDLDVHRSMHVIAKQTATRLSNILGIRISNLDGYAPSIKFHGVDLNVHVDGVGTKTLVLMKTGHLETAGWDCVAMNANDVACDGFKILALSNYIALDSSNIDVFKAVMKGIEEALLRVQAPLLSGETAILPGLTMGLDVVCITLSYRDREIVNKAKAGDVVIGVSSNGLHANGYSLVRKIVEERLNGEYNLVIDDLDLSEELSKPTHIYYHLVNELWEREAITGVAHITGGGWSKIKRVLGDSLDAVLTPIEPPRVFKFLMERGDVPVEEAYRVFNMGIGLVIFTRPESKDGVRSLVEKHGFKSYELGYTVRGSGKVVLSPSWIKGVEFEL